MFRAFRPACLLAVTVTVLAGLTLIPVAPSASAAAQSATAVTASTASQDDGKLTGTCTGGVCTKTFTVDGTWSEPASGTVTVTAAGGHGGYSGNGEDGGRGQQLKLQFTPTAGSIPQLSFSVGGEGGAGRDQTGGAGGAHGGGAGGGSTDGFGGGGGGGGTRVSVDGTLTLTAGGGGGAGGGYYEGYDGDDQVATTPGGDAGLDGRGDNGSYLDYGFGQGCGVAQGGGGVSPNAGSGGGGGAAEHAGPSVAGLQGGDGGAGGGGTSGGQAGCSWGGTRAAGSGGPAQGGAGAGSGAVSCHGLSCMAAQPKNGGGGGGGGHYGGGGGGTGLSLAGGGGGGGSSALGTGVTADGHSESRSGFVTVTWSYPTPTLYVSPPRDSTGPGQQVNLNVQVQGRQQGNGSAGTIAVAEQNGGGAGSVAACATPKSIGNDGLVTVCAVKPTAPTTYVVTYQPGGPYAQSVQTATVTVNVPGDPSTTVLNVHGTDDSVDLAASVSARVTPTGSVTFEAGDGNGHWTPLGSAPLTAHTGSTTVADAGLSHALPTGSSQVRATYTGGSGILSSSATSPVPSLRQGVDLSTDRQFYSYGDQVRLTATTQACSGQTVEFQSFNLYFQPVDSQTRTADADGTTTLDLEPSAGTYIYKAVVHSNCSANGATSEPRFFLVFPAQTTTDLVVDPNLVGGRTQVTATVSPANPGGSIPSGSVTITADAGDGQDHSLSGTLDNGMLTGNLSGVLPPGAYPVTVVYSGNANQAASTATAQTDVYRLTTTTSIAAPSSVPMGSTDVQAVVTVVRGSAPVTDGTVDVTTSAGTVTVPLDGQGQAKVTLPADVGIGSPRTVSAAFLGDAEMKPSNASASYLVGEPTTRTSITQVENAVTGGTVALDVLTTALVAPGTPRVDLDGEIEVREGSDLQAHAATTTSTTRPGTTLTRVSFPAPTTAGEHTYQVTWTSTADPLQAATSYAPITVNVLRPVTLAPGSSSYSVVAGEPVTIPVAASDSDGVLSSGKLYLVDGDTELTTAVDAGPQSSITFTPDWNDSAKDLQVVYSGDDAHEPKAVAVRVTTTQVATTAQLTITANGHAVAAGESVAPGSRVAVAVTVGAAGAEVPSGLVTLTATGEDSVTVPLANGIASTTFTDLPAGQVDVGATYAGPRRYSASTATQRFKMLATQGLSFTSTAPSPARSTDTYPVTISATGAGGAVSLHADGSCTVASSLVTFADPGTCTVTATRAADDDHDVATASQVITVVQHPQTVGIASTPPASAHPGDTYTVAPTSSTPGTTPVYAAGPAGVCSLDGLQVSLLHPGTCTVTADRPESTQYSAATQATQTITVSKIAQTVTITSTEPTGDAAVVGAHFAVQANGTGPQGNSIGVAVGPDTTNGACTVAGTTVTLRHPGLCQVVATQASSTDYAIGTDSHSVTVSAAKTHLSTPVVDSTSVSATVSVVDPGAGSPSGRVEFSVGGSPVGHANVGQDGVARLAYGVPPGAARTVAATYLGDDDFLASSGSLTRTDPTLTATLSSARPRSVSGWFRGPVTVTFHCVANGAALVGDCPGPVTLPHEGAGQSATATVTAVDGGAATLTPSGIDIDTTAPKAVVSGVQDGASYFGVAPTPRCTAVDDLSGGETCVVRTSRAGDSVSYVATATDRAGNSGVSVGSYQVTRTAIGGVDPGGDGVYTLRRGQKYVFVALTRGAAAPVLVAPGARKPGDDLGAMRQVTDLAGLNRWTRVWKASAPRGNRVRVMGIRFGSTTQMIRVRFVG